MGKLSKVITALLVSIFAAFNFYSFAQANESNINPPSFPTCESKIFTSIGDHDHSVNGNFYIIGIGWRSGNDDVYRLMDGNFLQCYCPTTGSAGIQSDWWNVSLAGLNQSQIDIFKSQGWFEEQGEVRNLPNYTFLVKNRDFSCAAPTATPTPTAAPTATVTPTPAPSATPAVTATPMPQGPISKCYDLEADKTEGSAPFTVTFKGHADDPSQNGKIAKYRFDFADASNGQQQVVEQSGDTASHTYNLSGNYEASLRIQDYAGNWRESDECKVKIKVSAPGQVLGITSPKQLPDTGASVGIFTAIVVLPWLGYFLNKHFRLV